MPVSQAQVQEFISLVEQGRFVSAMERFYAEDASMQENQAPPRIGLAKLIEHEKMVLSMFKEVRTRPAQFFVVDDNRVVINWIFDFFTHDGKHVTFDEISVQSWENGKIKRERFYYDPAQQNPK
jgi:ketosteroid isomerase-like protein